jgi:hypothetical protein
MIDRELIALDHGNSWLANPERFRKIDNCLSGTSGVSGTKIAHDANPMLQAVTENWADRQFKLGVKACSGIGSASKLGKGERTLGEVFKN